MSKDKKMLLEIEGIIRVANAMEIFSKSINKHFDEEDINIYYLKRLAKAIEQCCSDMRCHCYMLI